MRANMPVEGVPAAARTAREIVNMRDGKTSSNALCAAGRSAVAT
jgi:hypothetical protein